jgi:hypothetical protein
VKCNLSRVDRAIRIVVGSVAILAAALVMRNVYGAVLALAGAVLVFSGTVGFCHVYKVLGIRTLKKA